MSELLVLLESFYSTFGFTGEEIEDQRGELIAQSHAVELHGRTRGFFFFFSHLNFQFTALFKLWSVLQSNGGKNSLQPRAHLGLSPTLLI